jgi:hypothetical protein
VLRGHSRGKLRALEALNAARDALQRLEASFGNPERPAALLLAVVAGRAASSPR